MVIVKLLKFYVNILPIKLYFDSIFLYNDIIYWDFFILHIYLLSIFLGTWLISKVVSLNMSTAYFCVWTTLKVLKTIKIFHEYIGQNIWIS